MIREILALIVVFILLVSSACKLTLPKTIYKGFDVKLTAIQSEEVIKLKAINPLVIPMRFTFNSSIQTVDELLQKQNPHIVDPLQELVVIIDTKLSMEEVTKSIQCNYSLDILKTVEPDTSFLYQFPFPKGKAYKIIQAYNDGFTHNTDFSKFALDFKIPIGDTVCAAREGVVVGVVEKNEDWIHGNEAKYRDYANYVSLYHQDGTYTDYVHLKKDGALVALGDTVHMGQRIGISGYTGLSTTPHLHFNVYKPTGKGKMISMPIRFKTIDGKDIKNGMILTRN